MGCNQSSEASSKYGAPPPAASYGGVYYPGSNPCTGFEDPASLPMGLPKDLDAMDKAWFTELLRHRGCINPGDSVVSMEEKGVGMTAGYFSAIKKVTITLSPGAPASCPTKFVAKAWPSFELLPKDSIKAMFIKDIKGFSDFSAEVFYPRPTVYLATYDETKDLYALVMADCDEYSTHMVHETPLNLEQVKQMIPKMVQVALAFEGIDDADHPLKDAVDKASIVHFCSEGSLAVYNQVMPQGAAIFDEFTTGQGKAAKKNKKRPFHDDPEVPERAKPFVNWQNRGLGKDFSQKFTRCLNEYMGSITPENGGTVTVFHGDLRGDNLFFEDGNSRGALEHGWMAIDFQLLAKGPVISDLAYLMCSGSVRPDVYEAHTDAIVEEFYKQFMAGTKKYPDYTLAQAKKEFAVMTSVLYIYYVGMGAAIWMDGCADGPEKAGLGAAVEVGSGAITYADLTPEDKRKRMWWKSTMNNFSFMFQKYEVVRALNKCKPKKVDFKAAFDYTAPRGPPKK